MDFVRVYLLLAAAAAAFAGLRRHEQRTSFDNLGTDGAQIEAIRATLRFTIVELVELAYLYEKLGSFVAPRELPAAGAVNNGNQNLVGDDERIICWVRVE